MAAKFTIADRYGIERVIGSGGMGIVYEVTHLMTGHRYALKTIQVGLRDDPSMVTRILDESKVTAGIESEHIVRVTDGGIDQDTKLPFLVMELLDGASVAAELGRRGRLPAAEVVDLMYQARLALGKTHAAGVVHRDLKPENLFLARRDEGPMCLKILDFGIAKVVDTGGDAKTTRNLGTPLYMSPEQFRGDGDIDHHADIYALGHIAFALLTGHAYWEREARNGTYRLLRKVLEGAREPATRRAAALGVSLPQAFDRWFGRATARVAVRRFHDVAELVDALAAALDVELPQWSGTAGAARLAAAARALGRRRRRLASAMIAGVAIIAAFTVGSRRWPVPSAPALRALTPRPALVVQGPRRAAPVADSTPLMIAPPPHLVRTRSRSRPKIERPRVAAAVSINPGNACAAGGGEGAAAAGTRVAIWDGDGAGARAQGWEGCEKPLGCQSKVGLASAAGVNGSNGLDFHGEGPGWIGFGWNLFGWYPANAGVDLKPYSHLTFQIRVQATSPEEAPDPASVNVVLAGSANQNDSASVPVERYAKGFIDGKWHEVEIPIAQFVAGAGAKFDLGSFWELKISTWSGTQRRFDIYIDDIAVEMRCASEGAV